MKKKIISLTVLIMLTVTLLASCAESKDLMKPFREKEEEKILDPKEYIELGEYLGIDIKLIEAAEVTDEDVELAVKQTMYNYAETEEAEGPVQDGDIVIADYIGYIDGETSSNLQSTDEEIVIGLGSYIPGFESGMIGMSAGETKKIDLTFPDDYYSDMAGKDVTFEITVKEIYKAILPELTDEFAQENLMADSVDDYYDYVRESLAETAQQTAESEQVQELWKTVRENSNIFAYPQDEIDSYIADYEDYYKSMAEYSGLSLEEYLISGFGIDEEEFIREITEWAQEDIGTRLVILAIVENEGMDITDEEYEEAKENLLAQYGVTEDQFLEYYGQSIEEYYGKENIRLNVLGDRVYDLIDQNANYIK